MLLDCEFVIINNCLSLFCLNHDFHRTTTQGKTKVIKHHTCFLGDMIDLVKFQQRLHCHKTVALYKYATI